MSEGPRIKRREVRSRRACAEEAGTLSALAFRSKAHWGYDRDFLEACRGELTLGPEFIDTAQVHLLEADGSVIGFYSLVNWKSEIELRHFFVDPLFIGQGGGCLLWEEAVARARALGGTRLLIESDPHAEGFYLKLGAERIGELPSQTRPGRMLPLLLFPLTDGPD